MDVSKDVVTSNCCQSRVFVANLMHAVLGTTVYTVVASTGSNNILL